MNKVKCKLCGLKGFHNVEKSITEFHADRFLFVILKKKNTNCYICRDCIKRILSSLELEQYRIDKLYEPEIKEDEA